ncbi:MAG: transposase [Kofleriaceae bacterium]|nr:transposase [Kofleriaceae bacterium]
MVASSEKRTRGPNKQKPWARSAEDGASVLRLALDVSDPVQRARIEAMFEGAYSLRRALQRDARDRARAYWAAKHERAKNPTATRERLGLSRDALEDAAAAHVNAAPHLRRFVTKALAMHLADSVWTAIERHLFVAAKGKRFGMPRVGRWYDFRRLPGRARSHTRARKWETFRLHGSLAGHRAAYTGPDGDFFQPGRMPPVHADTWWTYDGPLAVVFSGLCDGTLVLPVRLPTAPCNQPVLDHHLADPSRWHKIDLVRTPDPSAPGGWRYEAHLMVLTQLYVSPSVAMRRANVALGAADRVAGIDVNVSNIAVASHEGDGRKMHVTRIERDATQKQRDRSRSRRERRRMRELERSRRAMNRAQYQVSKRQEKRARRRAERGLPPVETIPMGPRVANAAGVPLQSFKKDILSASYRRLRAAQAADAAASTQARRDRARDVAADVVATHGYQLVVEDVSVAAWSRSWGRAVAAFSPAALVAAIDREARAVAALAGGRGGIERASTRTTALSQHCPCGARASKRLADRTHDCARCQLRGDRDEVAAVLASFVVIEQVGDPSSERVDYDAARRALPEIRRALSNPLSGWQDTLSESTGLFAREGSSLTWWTPTLDSVAVARRIVGMAPYPTLDETGSRWTTPDRARRRTNRSGKYDRVWSDLRDGS